MTRPRLRSPDQPFFVRFLLGLYEFMASLGLAVVLIGGAAVVLAFATLVESAYGDANKSGAANWAVYQTWWFGAFQALLGLNVLCAALIRFPWKKTQTGFLMTHAGILLILGGSLATRLWGIDANVSILEGRSEWRAIEDQQHFRLVVQPNDASSAGAASDKALVTDVPFVPGPFNWDEDPSPWWLPLSSLGRRDRGVLYQRDGVKLETLDYYSDSMEIAVPRLTLLAGPPGGGLLGAEPGRGLEQLALAVKAASMGPMGSRRFGTGDRKTLARGQRVVFWMTGDPRETEAFAKALPEGMPGAQGQIVLWAGKKKFVFAADGLKPGERRKLEPTGLELELVRLEPQFGAAVLAIHGPGNSSQRMVLLADMPELNHQDDHNGVFGYYWLVPPADAPANPHGGMLQNAGRPRIDILQGADQKLYVRTWRAGHAEPAAPLGADGRSSVFWKGTGDALQLTVESFLASPRPETQPAAVRFLARKPLSAKQPRVRLRLTVDGRAEEFWLARLPTDPGELIADADQRIVEGQGRRVAVVLVPDQVDLGFRVKLDRFIRKLDPGTGQASHYSSLVDILDRHKNEALRKDVLITLNEPVNFSDPTTGRSFRLYQASFSGPFKPGDPAFESIAGTTLQDQVYVSVLSANYDPGRGLKYAGSLLVVAGVFVVFYMKAYFFARRPAEELRGEGSI